MVLAPRSVVVFSGAKILAKLSMMSWHEVCVMRTVWYTIDLCHCQFGALKSVDLAVEGL